MQATSQKPAAPVAILISPYEILRCAQDESVWAQDESVRARDESVWAQDESVRARDESVRARDESEGTQLRNPVY